MLLRFVCLLLLLSLIPQRIRGNTIDSLTQLVTLPAHDTVRGLRYLDLAKAWFWENPEKTDSLLNIAEKYLTPHNYYRGLSDIHNFKANYHYMGGRPLAACSSLDTAMHFAALDGDSLHIIGIRKNLTILRSEAGDIDGALSAIEESMQYLRAHKDSSLLAEHYVQRGLLRKSQGYRKVGLQDFQIAREIHFALKETSRVAEAEQHIGQILFDDGSYDQALPYFESAAENYERVNQQQYYAEVLTLLGATYHKLKEVSKSDSSFQAAIALSERLQQPYNIAHARLLRAESWLERNIKLSEGRKDAVKARSLYEEIMPRMAGNSHLILARIDYNLNQLNSALAEVEKSLDIFEAYSNIKNQKEALRLKGTILSRLNQPAAALKAYEQAQIIGDSLFSIEQSNAIAELHLVYDTKLKEREIALKAAQIDQLVTEKENVLLRNSLLSFGLITALVLLLLGYYAYRQRRKTLQIEVRHRERELAAQRLHLLQKNTILQQVEDQLSEQSNGSQNHNQQQLLNTLRSQNSLNKDWEAFTTYFKAVHANFSAQLDRKYPSLSITEKRLAYLLRLGTSTAEVAVLLHIQPESVRKGKYRLKKKLTKLESDNERSLEDILREIG